ncbi:MAG: DUF59 domain-containing protein [Bacteroidetes bacterium]|nr:DUF59 domain-containing protein [Bacteroidota bacterium]
MEGLTTEKAPSISVVLPHFVVGALFFLLLGVLLFLSDVSFTGHYFQPHILAITHITALGWGTMIIFGALYQLIPVIFGTSLYSERLAKVNLWLFVAGILALVYSFWNAGFTTILTYSSILVFITLGLFIFNILMSFRGTEKRNYSSRFIITSFFWLFLTAAFGLATALNFRFPFLRDSHLIYLKVHAHLGMGGWFLQLIMGVASTLVPMFLIAHNLNKNKLRIAYYLVNAGLILLVLDWLIFGGSAGLIFYWLLITASLVFFLSYLYDSFKKKLRKLDIGMQHTLVAFAALIIPAVVAILVISGSFFPESPMKNMGIFYGFGIFFAFISTLILGQTFKTLPFIYWLKKYQHLVGKQKVPMPRELYSEKLAKLQLITWIVTLLAFITGMLFENNILLKTGGAFFLLTAVLYNINIFKILLHKSVQAERPKKEEAPLEKNLMDILKTVMDPEVELNIVDLGLIYKLEYDGKKNVDIEMTFSTKACPLGDAIVMNIMEAIAAQYPELEVNVNVVFDPPWTPEKISEEGKKILAQK